MGDLASIVKAYDISGVVPDQLDEGVAEAVGAAFARLTGAAAIVTMHDMRTTSGPLAGAFGRGAAAQGADVLAGGLGSTDMLYYASGACDLPGAMVTASHNPARYNGIKLCRAGAKPVGIESGLRQVQEWAERSSVPAPVPGTISRRDFRPDYADHLRKLVDISAIRPLTVAVDAGHGMAGHTVPAVFEGLPITVLPLYFELDGTFPVEDQAAVTEQVKQAFAGRPGVSTEEFDGLTVSTCDWWFNLRPSNTEPLLRLNVEANTEAELAARRDEVLNLVRRTS